MFNSSVAVKVFANSWNKKNPGLHINSWFLINDIIPHWGSHIVSSFFGVHILWSPALIRLLNINHFKQPHAPRYKRTLFWTSSFLTVNSCWDRYIYIYLLLNPNTFYLNQCYLAYDSSTNITESNYSVSIWANFKSYLNLIINVQSSFFENL